MTVRVKHVPYLTDLDFNLILSTTLTESVYITPQYPYFPEFDYARIYLDSRVNRRHIVLYRPDKSKFGTSFARYYYSVYHSTVIPNYLEVDHDDNDTLNDNISNLKLLTQRENALKQNSIQQYPGAVLIIALCPTCGIYFTSEKKGISFSNFLQNRVLFCSNGCHQKTRSFYLPDNSIEYIKKHQIICRVREFRDGRVILEWINEFWVDENYSVLTDEKQKILAYRYSPKQEQILGSIKEHMIHGKTYAKIAQLTGIRWTIVRHHLTYYPEYFNTGLA